LMIQKKVYYVPTITAGQFVAEKAREQGFFHPIVVPKALAVGPQIMRTFSRAYQKGVLIAFGTDSGVSPHGLNAKEFSYMVKGGMKNMEAIKSATLVASQLLGISDDLGTLEKGKLADLIAVEGDPLQDISVLEKMSFVMKGGTVFKR